MEQKWKDFLVNGGIYDKIEITLNDFYSVLELLEGNYSIDAYCPTCKQTSVFRFQALIKDKIDGFKRDFGITEEKQQAAIEKVYQSTYEYLLNYFDYSPFYFLCSRDNTTVIKIYLTVKDSCIIKIGQNPSPIDISTTIPDKYQKVLGEHYREYKKSIELHTFGYFIGSYVYLRRIIEEIVWAAHDRMQSKDGWNEDQYKKSRFSEKVQLVKSELPDFFVTNVVMYGLVSKGIHELSEDECKKMYPVLKASIEFVLDDIIARKEQEKKRKEAQEAISKFAQELGNNK